MISKDRELGIFDIADWEMELPDAELSEESIRANVSDIEKRGGNIGEISGGILDG